MILDQLKPVAELDGAGNLVSTFVYGSKYQTPDLIVRGGVEYRVVSDHLGSVRLVVDAASGAVVQRLDYDAWGVVVNDTNPGWQPFGYAGGLYDAETGLVRFGARDYDPEVGRWTAKDPVELDDGPNLYQYAFNDPVNFWDFAGESATNGNDSRGNWYGNWCGPGGSDMALNCIDQSCKEHDQCYERCGLRAASRWLPKNWQSKCAAACDAVLAGDIQDCLECGN